MPSLRNLPRYLLAGIFVVGGALHFLSTQTYLRLMPPQVPYPQELVYLSGIIESGLGIMLLIPKTGRIAAWALIHTLIAIFPANIYGAVTSGTDHPAMPGVPVVLAWLRLPVQFLLIAWAYLYTRRTA
jgi:uncharacterized membrane protein